MANRPADVVSPTSPLESAAKVKGPTSRGGLSGRDLP